MKPDAQYILELEKIFDEQRSYKKDSEAIRLTIETCCDIDELKGLCPEFLNRTKNISLKCTKNDRIAALSEIASAISDTRNMLAHAKTNYKNKGNECPESQMDQFADCCKLVALQVIRWYSRQHETAVIK